MKCRPATSTRWPSSSTGSFRASPLLAWALALATVLAGLSLASAASLAVGSATLGSATAPLTACHTGALVLRYRVNAAAQITHVTVRDLAGTCAGGTIRLTLTNSAGFVVGSATQTLAGDGFDGSISLSISSTPAASSVVRAFVAIDGR